MAELSFDDHPFPTDGLVPESRQIGRAGAITDLARLLSLRTVRHRVILEPRRVGKSSTAQAALDHLRADRVIAFSVDLRADALADEAALCRRLRECAIREGITGKMKISKVAGDFTDALRSAPAAQLGKVARALALPDADAQDAAEIGTAVAGLLLGDRAADVGDIVAAIDAWAAVHERQVVGFIDEVQDLAGWTGTAAHIERAMRAGLQATSLLFAGSHRTGMDQLFGPGGPLEHSAITYDLPQIPDEEWLADLPGRFEEAGCHIKQAQVLQLLAATRGHPLRTNQVCATAAENTPAGALVTAAAVDYAVSVNGPRWAREDQS